MSIAAPWKVRWKAPARLWSRFNPGLQFRLAFAFGAVLVLALAANLLAERRVADVERQLQPPPPPPPPVAVAPPPVELLPAPVAAPVPVVVVPDTSIPLRVSDDLLVALKAYVSAVEARRTTSDPAMLQQLDAAADVLRTRGRRFAEVSGASLGRAQRQSFETELTSLQASSLTAIELADRRRATWREYQKAVDALAVEVRQRFDGAFRIFGRVIARQQMVALRDRVEELRHIAVDRALGSSGETADLVASEKAVASILGPPSKDAAMVRMQAALDGAGAAREAIEAIDVDEHFGNPAREELVNGLQRRVKTMSTQMRTAAERAAREAAAVRAAAAAVAAAAPAAPKLSPTTEIAPPGPVIETPAVVVTAAPVEALPKDTGGSRRRVLLWITAAVLAVTLVISILTVRSLVNQVSRLLVAIRKVARGESVSVSAGGIRELDVLAGEFNAMSSRLAEAREDNARYQRELEHRVNERTAQLHHQATHDPLTELPNRRDLSRLLGDALQLAKAQDARVGVFLIDLDHFKVLNDSLGHAFGDRVLVAMAQRLRSIVPPGGFAARLGGDEFTVVSPPMLTLEEINDFGWQLVRGFQRPLLVDTRELMLSVSVGCAVCPDHQGDADALLQAADAALFRAKAEGRSQLALYAPEMRDAAAVRFSTEQALRRAVDRGEFELRYQPEVELCNFEVRMLEALLRWRLPDGRLAAPGEFLVVAEESGLVAEIGDWVLREAIQAAGRWHRSGWHDVRVAVNVSPRQLLDQGFVNRLGDLLAMYQVKPSAIEVELTENVLQTGAPTVRTLEGLRELGVGAALDDFGTGYSTLASLEHLPLSRVKLDRSLIAGIDTNRRSAAIARAILSLCDGLGLEVTAEGIERPAQFQALSAHPHLLLQGYLLSKPLGENEILDARNAMPEQLAALLLAMTPGPLLVPADGAGLLVPVDAKGRTGYL